MSQSNDSGDLFDDSDSNGSVSLNTEKSNGINLSSAKKNDEASSSKLKSEKEDSRPPCRYASQCYRKNPVHLAEFKHPEKPEEPESDGPSSKRQKLEGSDSKNSTKDLTKSTIELKKSSEASCSFDKKCGAEIIEEAKPLSFLLTKVSGINLRYNHAGAVDIKDLLCPSLGELIKSAQFNYCIDVPWVVSQYPTQFRTKPLLIVHGSQRAEKADLDMAASAYDNVKLCQAPLEMSYGTHHTKMMFLEYDVGLRIVIHTANLRKEDWFQKTQGVWVSDLFTKLPSTQLTSSSSIVGDSVTNFKKDLISYLSAYGRQKSLEEWINTIKEYDMSTVRVYLIGSVPGRHAGERKTQFGHLKLRKILKENCKSSELDRSWPVIGQFSSVGSLGPKPENWMCAELLESLSASQTSSRSFLTAKPRLQLVFPSKENVRTSLEGYMAGAALPYSRHTAVKQPYFTNFLQLWKAGGRGRSRASPHIKTYTRVSPESKKLAWFLVTSCGSTCGQCKQAPSANMSKAAWGALEKNDSQLMIRSYELGVLFLPQHFDSGDSFLTPVNGTSDESCKQNLMFPVPYDLPLTPYEKEDKPWIWDIPYTDLPDSHGNQWSPS